MLADRLRIGLAIIDCWSQSIILGVLFRSVYFNYILALML